jgi:hypothetical protein
LLESIEQEERFAKLLFKEEAVPVIEETIVEQPKQMIVEADPLDIWCTVTWREIY